MGQFTPTSFNWGEIALFSATKKNLFLSKFPDALERAEQIARHSFGKHQRRDKTLTIGHMERVAKYASAHGDSELTQIAWLHDMVEEKKLSLKDLQDLQFSPRVVNAVEALTKRDMQGEGYLNYIERLAQNVDAITVKLFDICDNTSEGVKPDRLEFLYPVAKAYLVESKRRHNNNQPLQSISEFMCHSPRVQRIRDNNVIAFHGRTEKHYAGTVPCYGIG